MFNRILVTDGGPHPPADWARVTTEDLIPLDGLPSSHQGQGMILRGRLVELLADHYQQVQEAEQQALRDNEEAFDAELQGHPDFGHLFAEIQAAARGTPWEGHITGEAVIDAIRTVIDQHVRHMRHIERLWQADRKPQLKAGQAYRERHGLPPSPGAEPAPEPEPAAKEA